MKLIPERRAKFRTLTMKARTIWIAVVIGCCMLPYAVPAQDGDRVPVAGPAASQEQPTCRDEARPDDSCTTSGQRLYKVFYQKGREVLHQPGKFVGQGRGIRQRP